MTDVQFLSNNGRHFTNAQLKPIMYPFCRSLRGNKIEELPAGVFSNNNKLLNLWVGRLKGHSRPTYFYCKILPQILVNSNILKYYQTTTSCLINWLLISQATIVLKEEPYLLADHWSRVLEDTYVSDWGSITIVYLDDVNQTSSVVDIPFSRGVRLCPLKYHCPL